MTSNVNINNPISVKEAGLNALMVALGAVGTARFIQQLEEGKGDYTKEKYNREDYTFDELDKLLRSI